MINWGIKFFLAKLGQMIIKLDIGSKQRTVKLAFILPVLLLAIISMANCGQFAKPTHQLSLEQKYPGNLVVLPKKPYLAMLMTKIRNCETVRSDFIFYSEAILRLLIEESLNMVPMTKEVITTPTGAAYNGLQMSGSVCGVSIVRAGESMEKSLREVLRSVKIGKILIQRDEATALPKFYYGKIPAINTGQYVLLLDPMLATGGSASVAIQYLLNNSNVSEDHIIFVNLVASPAGIVKILEDFPKVRILTAEIDPGMNERAYIVPGLGDFGCRYYGTDGSD